MVRSSNKTFSFLLDLASGLTGLALGQGKILWYILKTSGFATFIYSGNAVIKKFFLISLFCLFEGYGQSEQIQS